MDNITMDILFSKRSSDFSQILDQMQNDGDISERIRKLGEKCVQSLRNKGKIIFFGNGGSAADAQHLSAELVGRYQKERGPLAAIALTTDTSALTAIANDFHFDFIFSRQIEALASENDVVIGISTSGNSENVIMGIKSAKKIGAFSVSFVGSTPGKLAGFSDLQISIPSDTTALIQQAHMVVGHVLCEYIEENI